jgi:hypothetical protein
MQPAAEPQSSALSTAADLAGDAAEAWTSGDLWWPSRVALSAWWRQVKNSEAVRSRQGRRIDWHEALRGGGAKALEMAKNAGGFLKANAGGIAKTAAIAHLATSGIEAAYDSFHTSTDEYAKRMGSKLVSRLPEGHGHRALGTMQDLGQQGHLRWC